MHQKIVIAGGTGFIGKYLTTQFRALGHEVLIIARGANHIPWTDESKIIAALAHADLLINLAGKSVDCRYNERNKKDIIRSRTMTTKALGDAILKCAHPPKLWINSSTATIYRHALDRPMSENQGEIGKGFSVNVAKEWEKVFFGFKIPRTRQIALRMAIVLGSEGGVVKPLSNLVRLGLGGKQGDGKQLFSWLHIEDLFQIILFLQANKDQEGVFNCASPSAIDNAYLMKSFRKALHIKIGLPSPSWLLSIGAVLINTETELILKSRWVIPERLLQAGYEFKYPTIEVALAQIFAQHR